MSQLNLDLIPPETSLPLIWKGIITEPPINFQARVSVSIPDMNPDLNFEDIRWQARDNLTLPEYGDECLVIFDNHREPWVASWWPADKGNTTIVGLIADGPPPNPIDGDIWIAKIGTTGVRWQLQYNAGSASPYKWESIGGSPISSSVDTLENITSATYVAMATPGPSVTLPRAGDYMISIGADITCSINDLGRMSFDIGATAANDNDGVTFCNNPGGAIPSAVMCSRIMARTGFAANTTLVMKYRGGSVASCGFRKRAMSVWPIRVS